MEDEVKVEEETAEAAEIEESAPLETEEPAEDDAATEEEKPKSKGVQKRIDELVRQREDERRRAEKYEAMLHEMYQQQKPKEEPKPPAQSSKPARPTLEQFEYDDARYNQALAEYEEQLVDWKLAEREKVTLQRQEQEKEAQARKQVEEGLDGLAKKGLAKDPDFLSKAYVPAGMEEAFLRAENAVELALYLGGNREELARLHSMPKDRAMFELGKIDARLSIKPPNLQSKAPPPIKPVGGSDRSSEDWLNDPTISTEEWIRRRAKQTGG